jgi:hypothetical protein
MTEKNFHFGPYVIFKHFIIWFLHDLTVCSLDNMVSTT